MIWRIGTGKNPFLVRRTFKILATGMAVLCVFLASPAGIPQVISPALAAEEKAKPRTSAADLLKKLKAAREKAAARRARAAPEEDEEDEEAAEAAEEDEEEDAEEAEEGKGADLIEKLKAARKKAATIRDAEEEETEEGELAGEAATDEEEGPKSRADKIVARIKAAAANKKKSPTRPVNGASSLLFGTKEVKSTNLKPFPKWTGMLDRYFQEKKLKDEPCSSTKFNKCHLAEWNKFLKSLEDAGKTEQIKAVNKYMNEAKYIIDPKNYHVPDYWATPGQFFNKDGDCEDYAIAKFMSLRALGFTNEEIRIVVLQDMNLDIPHSVLVVYRDGVPLVLDNQIPQVIPAAGIVHYKPIYSMNEESWWLHKN